MLAGIDSPLEAQIERYIKSLRATGRISSAESTAWVVHDLSTGTQLASINASTPLQAASMVKPLIALAFFHQVKAGRLSYGSTSRRHLELMIQRSSNTSTNWVMRQVGGPAATKALLARHYPSVCRNLRLVEYIPASGRAYQNLASANDYMYFLAALWQKRLPYATEILRLMALPGTDRLFDKASRVPPGTRVYDKTGSTAMCCGDMGILVAQGTNGRSYPYIIIGIISRSSRTASYGSWIGLRSNVIREVSNLTYQYLKQRHPLR
ncbi:MAG: serine hydrolase [Verrucomicrobiales bacterium]|nr:serine hydrolase [Verrucomicrobiales bacterium]